VRDWLRVQAADVVFIQEMPQDNILPLLYQLGPDYPYASAYDSGDLSHLLLARHPIREKAVLAQFDLETPYAVYRYTLDIQGEWTDVYAVNLAQPTREPRLALPFLDQQLAAFTLGYDDQPRNQQLDFLLDQITQGEHPFILVGNLNLGDQSVTYTRVAARLKDAYREAGRGFGATWPVGGAGGFPHFVPPLLRIDYIWYNQRFRALDARLGPRLDSTHLPLYANLELVGK
jgi:endonuclease/exonuclease/phosphatase (EEP) superfamily protein YafD